MFCAGEIIDEIEGWLGIPREELIDFGSSIDEETVAELLVAVAGF